MSDNLVLKKHLKGILNIKKLNVYCSKRYNMHINRWTYPKENYSGIYWLLDNSFTIVYIGYSTNIVQRLYSHSIPSNKKEWCYCRFVVLDKSPKILRAIEFSLIYKIRPKYNSSMQITTFSIRTKYINFKSDSKRYIKLGCDYYLGRTSEDLFHPESLKNVKQLEKHKQNLKIDYNTYMENYNKLLEGNSPDFSII